MMVLMYRGKRDGAITGWCERRGWKVFEPNTVYGCEAKVVVLLDCLVYPEFISRAIHLLVIVTNNRSSDHIAHNKSHLLTERCNYRENRLKLQHAVDHGKDSYQCWTNDCDYGGIQLIEKRTWTKA